MLSQSCKARNCWLAMAAMLSASRCHETTQREMRSAADLFASIEQLPGPPVRPPTDGPGVARRKVRLNASMTKPILARDSCIE